MTIETSINEIFYATILNILLLFTFLQS